jgi:hypothetical protein
MDWMNNEGVGWTQGGCVYLWNEYLIDKKSGESRKKITKKKRVVDVFMCVSIYLL